MLRSADRSARWTRVLLIVPILVVTWCVVQAEMHRRCPYAPGMSISRNAVPDELYARLVGDQPQEALAAKEEALHVVRQWQLHRSHAAAHDVARLTTLLARSPEVNRSVVSRDAAKAIAVRVLEEPVRDAEILAQCLIILSCTGLSDTSIVAAEATPNPIQQALQQQRPLQAASTRFPDTLPATIDQLRLAGGALPLR
ncbi:MAG: hypothetical protein R3E01_12535 [Pirellulaceae bacterium]|nr:hypothetical protein [Planctomycetales bacterium]MCA9266402.1 hypothetical protein [Planctomycetales bacterium]